MKMCSGNSNRCFSDKRPKRSVRDVFRMGLFLSKKNKKKKALDPATGISQEPHTSLGN